jgi:hypothetical protein
MKNALRIIVIILAARAVAGAQVAPAATGPSGVPITGNFRFDTHYSQSAEFGGSLGNWQTSTASAELGYSNDSTRRPFSLNYAGGYTWTISGPDYSNGLFQRLSLTQGILWHKWVANLSDGVGYRPQAPTTGFSGIAGIGEPIGVTEPTSPITQSILTVNTHTLDNNSTAELQHPLTHATTLSFGGSYDLLRYPDGNGLDTDSQMENAGVTWRINARNSFSSMYDYSRFSYPGYDVTFNTDTAMFSYNRAWSRRLSTQMGAGPEWIEYPASSVMPAGTMLSVNASMTYALHFGTLGAGYSRGTNGGAGYMVGGKVDAVTANFSREIRKTATFGITGAYTRNQGLQTIGTTNNTYGGVQASQQMGRYLSAYANYTAASQSSSAALPANALNDILQTVSFGIGYSPKEKHFNH